MRRESVTKVAVVRSTDPEEFANLFNSKMDELADNKPTHQITDTGSIISAVPSLSLYMVPYTRSPSVVCATKP